MIYVKILTKRIVEDFICKIFKKSLKRDFIIHLYDEPHIFLLRHVEHLVRSHTLSETLYWKIVLLNNDHQIQY